MNMNNWMEKWDRPEVTIFSVKQSWAMKEPQQVLEIIKQLGIWRLGNLDGCCCSRFSVRNVDVEISCGKGGPRCVRVSSPSLDYMAVELLRPIAEEVKRQLEECDGRGPAPIELGPQVTESGANPLTPSRDPNKPSHTMTAQAEQTQPPPIGAASPERDIDDRLGEALRRIRHGLIRPLWHDMTEESREGWRNIAQSVRMTTFKDVGLRIEIAP